MKKGFTLVELIVAISIFILIMTVSMGSIISVFNANRKSRTLKASLTNLNIALESMSKEMRFGKNYHCATAGAPGTLTQTQNCSSGGTLLSFLSSNNVQTTYRFNNQAIEKQVGIGGTWIVLTSPEVTIDDSAFYTVGAGTSGIDALRQPKILMRIKGHAGSDKNRTNYTLQTLVSQRSLDI